MKWASKSEYSHRDMAFPTEGFAEVIFVVKNSRRIFIANFHLVNGGEHVLWWSPAIQLYPLINPIDFLGVFEGVPNVPLILQFLLFN